MKWGSAVILGSTTMAGTVYSMGIDLQQEWVYSIQSVWTGSALGTQKIQVSNDNPPRSTGVSGSGDASAFVTNWSDYTTSLSSISATAGTSSFVYNVSYPGYRWARWAYTGASGSGTVWVQYFGKGG